MSSSTSLTTVTIHKLHANISDTALRKYASLCAEGWQSTKGDHTYLSELVMSPIALQSTETRKSELQDPQYHVWIAISPNIQNSATSLEHGIWTGMVHVRGPFSRDRFLEIRGGLTDGLTAGLETFWRSGGLYFKPVYRSTTSYQALDRTIDEFTASHALLACEEQQTQTALVRIIFAARIGHVAHAIHMANGHRQLTTATPVDELQWSGVWDKVAQASLSQNDYTRTTWTVFESCREVKA